MSNPPSTKICKYCKEEKPRAQFSRKGGKADARKSHCYSCAKYKDKKMTPEQVDSLTGVCCICTEDATVLDHDHDHMTGHFRGELCNRCNIGLGYWSDRVDLLKAAVKYLKYHQTP